MTNLCEPYLYLARRLLGDVVNKSTNYCEPACGTMAFLSFVKAITMPRFYCPIPLVSGSTLELPERVMRHVQVLRLQTGDGVVLCNGNGNDVAAEIVEMGRVSVRVLLKEVKACYTESPLH